MVKYTHEAKELLFQYMKLKSNLFTPSNLSRI